jgi:hypothetical protein
VGVWDYEGAKASGYPEEYTTWYYKEYLPAVGDDSVGLDNAIHIWQTLKPPAQGSNHEVPEGTLINSRDAGANAGYIDTAREIIPDVTDKLNRLMTDTGEKYKNIKEEIPNNYKRAGAFANIVATDREYDLKNKPEWQKNKYIYDGEVVDGDVPGNIHYGWLGKVFDLPDNWLTNSAGIYQITQDALNKDKSLWSIVKNFNWDSLGDDPRDTARIRQGIEIHKNRQRQ